MVETLSPIVMMIGTRATDNHAFAFACLARRESTDTRRFAEVGT